MTGSPEREHMSTKEQSGKAEKKMPSGPATGTVKTRAGGGLLWNSCPGLL